MIKFERNKTKKKLVNFRHFDHQHLLYIAKPAQRPKGCLLFFDTGDEHQMKAKERKTFRE